MLRSKRVNSFQVSVLTYLKIIKKAKFVSKTMKK